MSDESPTAKIDELVTRSAGWRGDMLAQARAAILDVDPGIVEEWKYMGAPVWSLGGTLVVGNVFTEKVKLGFLWGASLPDPDGLFNGELGGNQRRSVEFSEGDEVRVEPLKALVRAAIEHNAAKAGKKR
ncbi:DUF1801 domain-containing protein [Kineococcus sp. R86509]|uniref:DUF1801 domain-containing protein n=1 Tax=Kineococcus sp. R86509 TaxID=3093851 RepID=UPI0036D2D874